MKTNTITDELLKSNSDELENKTQELQKLNILLEEKTSETQEATTPEKLLPETEISRAIAAHSLFRFHNTKASDFPDQQFSSLCSDYCQPVSMPLAGGIIFSLDQATLENKSLLWDIGKCRKNSNMDSNFRLCTGRYYQKTPQFGSKPLLDSTDFEFITIGENAHFTST